MVAKIKKKHLTIVKKILSPRLCILIRPQSPHASFYMQYAAEYLTHVLSLRICLSAIFFFYLLMQWVH